MGVVQDKEAPQSMPTRTAELTPNGTGVSGEHPRHTEVLPRMRVMPDFVHARHGFYHTVDSVLATLTRAGIGPERVTIKKIGRGWNKSRVVRQTPPPGAPFTPDAAVELTVEGDNAFYYLPTGMRDFGKDPETGNTVGTKRVPMVDDLVLLFDDPLEKAAFAVRHGGLYFDLRPDNLTGCARWIRLLGVDPDDWPREIWYRLAVLLPSLHHLAGQERGIRLALQVLLGLNIHAFNRKPKRSYLQPEQHSLLGRCASCLGYDFVLGDGMEDEAEVEITLGPVSLMVYREFQKEGGRRRLDQVLRFVLPYHLSYSIRWLVEDRNRAPRLGIEPENSVLGVNMHLGKR